MNLNSIFFDHKELHPSKVICIGRNYVEHIEELNNEPPTEPVIFLKPNSAVAHCINLPSYDDIHYEAELSFLIIQGKLKGVGLGLDLTKRSLQSTLKTKGLPWERAKAFDHSAVFSKFTAIPHDISDLSFELWINNTLVQQGDYHLMINKPNKLLAEAQSFLTCLDGDLLLTGTPKGVGKLNIEDNVIGKVFSKQQLIIEAHWIT